MEIKLLLTQPHILSGNLSENYKTIQYFLTLAEKTDASYVFFPKDTLTGSNLGTLSEQDDFQQDVAKLNSELQKENKHHLQIIFSDDYNLCGYHIKPKSVGISFSGKNIKVHTGGSAILDDKGEKLFQLKLFQQDALELTFDTQTFQITSGDYQQENYDDTGILYHTLCLGLKEFLNQTGIKRMTVGLSGGIDSAVAAALYVDILGANNVLLLNMPNKYNSQITQQLAQITAQNLGAKYAVIPISDSVNNTIQTIENIGLTVNTLTEENIQARDRSSRLIAAASAAFGGAFSANGNKAELSVGYATFYGDLAGAVAPLGDLWKHQVYALGKYFNKEVFKKDTIHEAIFQIRPSAELSEQQTVGKGGDPLYYPYHDYLFNAFTKNISLSQIAKWYKKDSLEENLGCNKNILRIIFKNNHLEFFADLEHWWYAYHSIAVAKRLQAPPIIIVSDNPLNTTEPQLKPYFSEEYIKIKKSIIE